MHSHRGMFAALGTIVVIGLVAVACGGSQQGEQPREWAARWTQLATGQAALSVSLCQRANRSPDEIRVRVQRWWPT